MIIFIPDVPTFSCVVCSMLVIVRRPTGLDLVKKSKLQEASNSIAIGPGTLISHFGIIKTNTTLKNTKTTNKNKNQHTQKRIIFVVFLA